MSNEVPSETVDARRTDDDPDARETPAQPLVLIAGDDGLVCVDDTCLPPDAAR